jgi:DNA-binding MarR family transcriptional regulator
VPPRPPTGIAFLLSQLGAHVSARFAERLAPLDLRPSHAGLLRLIAADAGSSQQQLAERVGTAPSRVVKLLDELEERGLIERRRSTADRRHHEVHLAGSAANRLAEVRRAVRANDAELIAPLTDDERDTLLALLTKLSAAKGANPQAHPGYASPP